MRHPPQQLALTGGDHTGGSDISISHIRLAGLSVDRNLRRSDVETDAPVPMAAECPMISHTVENVRALTLSGFSRAVDIMKERTITQGERARFQAGDVCQIQWSSQAAAGSHLSGLRLLNGWCTVELDTLDIGSLRKLHMAGRRSGCTYAPTGSCIGMVTVCEKNIVRTPLSTNEHRYGKLDARRPPPGAARHDDLNIIFRLIWRYGL